MMMHRLRNFGRPRRAPDTRRRRRTHAERRETTRRQLLDAAIGCLHERGFSGATLEIIAKRAGVSRGSVQFHFGNRDDLFLALIDEIRVRLSKIPMLEKRMAKSLDERLVRVCDHYWRILSSPDFTAAVQVHVGTLHDTKLYPQVSRVLKHAQSTLDRQWVQIFSDLRIPADRLIVARHVALSAMRGMAIKLIDKRANNSIQKEIAMLLDMLKWVLRH
jgi:AcrR family transcriptional regulator